MTHKTHLRVFDFDDTLFRIPNYTCSEAKGYSPIEWFDSKESLDQNKFNIKGILNIIEEALDECSENYMITQRVNTLKPQADSILEQKGIKFIETFFLGRNSKSEILDSLIKPWTTKVTIYEDSLFEILKYIEYFKKNRKEIEIYFVFVDKSKIFKYKLENLIGLTDFESIDKLRIS